MAHDMIISFPGGKKVNAQFMEHTMKTDQPERAGGDGTAPAPFVMFLGSLGTCAGIYVLGFCEARGISTDGIQLRQRVQVNPLDGTVVKISMDIEVPDDFPKQYHSALVRAADQCAVKKLIQNPPEFDIKTVVT
jgi:ribosomal protein S12 methylthiotransferase accessory factor